MKKRRISKKFWALMVIALIMIACTAMAVAEYFGYGLPTTAAQRKVWDYAAENGHFYWEYPRSLVDLLERNPETEQFVLEYPSASAEVFAVDLSEYENCETVPLFMQWDQRWGYKRYGSDVAGLTGCGPVSLSMAAVYLTGDAGTYSPDKMLDFAIDGGYCVPGSGSSWTLISEGGEKLGFDVTELPLDENRIRKTLEADIPIIFVVGPGDFTTTGHFMVMVGWENGLIRINDSNSRANSEKLWAYEDIQGQIKNLWSIEAGSNN